MYQARPWALRCVSACVAHVHPRRGNDRTLPRFVTEEMGQRGRVTQPGRATAGPDPSPCPVLHHDVVCLTPLLCGCGGGDRWAVGISLRHQGGTRGERVGGGDLRGEGKSTVAGADSEGLTVPLSLWPPSAQGRRGHFGRENRGCGAGSAGQCAAVGVSWGPPANCLGYQAPFPFALSLMYCSLHS